MEHTVHKNYDEMLHEYPLLNLIMRIKNRAVFDVAEKILESHMKIEVVEENEQKKESKYGKIINEKRKQEILYYQAQHIDR